jgi:hypothetical protein
MKWADRGLAVAAWAVLAGILAAALHDVSLAWDVWYYHLPFAARIAGIVPADQFAYDPMNQARFDGFPLLGEALQGLLWRITGRPESANLVAFSAVPLFAFFMKKKMGVPMHATLLALLAIPLVMIHATSCYVDLPANACVAALVLLAIRAWSSQDEKTDAKTLALALMLGAVAANMKAMMHPIVLVALVALVWRALVGRSAPSVGPGLRAPLTRRAHARAWWMVACFPIVFFTPLKNLILHHNPYYPVAMSVFGHTLPGPDDPYSSSPMWLEHAPRPVRFLCSILELGVHDRWTVDQWTPPEATGYRMGGYFGAYVVFNVAFFAWRAVRERADRRVRAATIGFVVLTAIVSVLPQSHELRYYMGWMIVLVSLNVWLSKKVVWTELACAASLVAVLVVTRASYAYPSGNSFDDLVKKNVQADAIAKVHDGDRVCVRHAPWNFLWAARFHAPKSYAVREAEQPAECEGARPL